MSEKLIEALRIIEDWEYQASERDNRDPMKGQIYREAKALRAALAAPDGLFALLTHLVEDGDIWAKLPPDMRKIAMDAFQRLAPPSEAAHD